MKKNERYLTSEEAGLQLDLTPARIRQLCQGGLLPGAEKRGRDWMIPEAALAKYKPRPAGWPAGRPRGAKKDKAST